MGLYYILDVDDGTDGAGIQFHWGKERLIRYSVGDRIDWDNDARPEVANQRIKLAGLRPMERRGGFLDFDYFLIAIDNDIIVDFEKISEEEFNLIECTGPI